MVLQARTSQLHIHRIDSNIASQCKEMSSHMLRFVYGYFISVNCATDAIFVSLILEYVGMRSFMRHCW